MKSEAGALGVGLAEVPGHVEIMCTLRSLTPKYILLISSYHQLHLLIHLKRNKIRWKPKSNESGSIMLSVISTADVSKQCN